MNSLSFNQDFSCLLVSTNKNHRIFNCDPFGEFYTLTRKPSVSSADVPNLDDSYSGTFLLKMLFLTSLTIIVPAAENGNHRVLKIFNLKQNLKICELTFALAIVDVMLNRKRLVVFLEIGQIYIYDLSSVRLIKVLEIESYAKHEKCEKSEKHPNCVTADLSPDDASFLVLPLSVVNELTDLLNAESAPAMSANDASDPESSADPSHISPTKQNTSDRPNGLVSYVELTRKNDKMQFKTLHDLHKDSAGWVVVYDTISLRPRLVYKAHDSAIAKIAISSDSKFVATASEKGTIVRVSHIEDSESVESNTSPVDPKGKLAISQVTNLRRGHNPARINALKFNLELTILGCASESGTVHLFSMKGPSKHDSLHANDANLEIEDSHDNDASFSEDEPSRLSSLEDLNENLANLLILKDADEPAPKTTHHTETRTYFSALKSSAKFINNPYTKLLVKRLPYRNYIKNLIWEKPRRSFAYVRVPESDAGAASQNVEIGFSSAGCLMVASYGGNLYQYRFPREALEERAECELVSQDSLME